MTPSPGVEPPRVLDDPLVDYRNEAVSREELTRLGSGMWEAALDWLYGQGFRTPVRTSGYADSRGRFFPDTGEPGPAPASGTGWEAVLGEFTSRIASDAFSSYQPRTFAYFTPPPLVMSICGEVLAQWLNQGVDIWHGAPSATFVEEEVIGWLRALVGFPEDSFGVLTSGGAMANLMAMAVARDRHLGRDGAKKPRAAELEDAAVYAGDQAHFSIARALDLLGFPADALRIVPTDADFHLLPGDLEDAIERDIADGARPFAVVAVAGTTNTGAVDPIRDLAAVARHHGLWFHVDAAYGGAARLSRRDADRVAGLELADSVTLDPHKWFFQPYDIGGLLVRNGEDLLGTFRCSPEYLRTVHDEPLDWFQHSMEGTRRFRGLKLWMAWKHLGTAGLGQLIEQTNDLAAYLAHRCNEDPAFDAAVERPELSVVCFRVLPPNAAALTGEELDTHQDRVQQALEQSGDGWVSTTRLRGRTYLRAGIMNYMSTEDDIDRLLDVLQQAGSV